MFWNKEMKFFYVLSVCFSCNCILVFPQQDVDACGVALGSPCLPSFPIEISEVKENACPANVGVSLSQDGDARGMCCGPG